LIIISKHCSFTSDPSTFKASIHPNMRIQCNLLSLFLLGLVLTSMVEASRKRRHKKKKVKKMKGRVNHPPLSSILLDDLSDARNEVLVPPVHDISHSFSLLSIDSSSVERNRPASSSSPQISTTSDLSSIISFFGPGFFASFRGLRFKSSEQNDRKINIDTIHSSSSLLPCLLKKRV
jgi:hypothetical protein